MARSGVMMLALAAQSAAVAPTPPVTPVPTGGWQLDYGTSRCSLAHSYRVGKREAILVFERSLSPRWVVVTLSYPANKKQRANDGQAMVSIGGATSAEVGWDAVPAAAGFEIVTFSVTSDLIVDAPAQAKFTFVRDKREPIALALPGLKKVWLSLEACRVDLLKHWNVDPDEDGKVAREPEAIGGEGMFVWTDDYPYSAVQAGAEGTTSMLTTIDTSGRVAECRVVESSGFADLDTAACAAFSRRGKYQPAIGRDGVAMNRHIMSRVNWRLPR